MITYEYPSIHHLFMDIHHSVMDIRDLKYKLLTAVMYIHHSITAVHNSKLLYPFRKYKDYVYGRC